MPKNTSHHLPLYRQIEQQIARKIQTGDWKSGQMLPSEWDLAAQMGASQGTVRKALMSLTAQGLLQRQQGVGTFVTGASLEWGRLALCEDHARHRPIWPRQEVLSVMAVPCVPAVRVQLNLPAGQKVWQVQSVWRHGRALVALDEAWLPMNPLPDLNVRQLSSRSGIYELLDDYGFAPALLQAHIQPILPDADTALRLKIPAYAPALRYERLVGQGDMVLEWRCRVLATENLLLTLPQVT